MAVRKVYVTKRMTFEACHNLNNYEGKCSRKHGHSYKLEVTFVGGVDTESINSETPATDAMVIDFSEIKKMISEKVVSLYDHSDLNAYFYQPTAEAMAVDIFDTLVQSIGNTDYSVYSVKLWETEDSYAEYRGEYID